MTRPEQGTHLRVHVHLDFGYGRDTIRKLFDLDLTPDPTAYGFHRAEGLVDSVSYSEDRTGLLWGLARRVLRKMLHMDLLHAWHNRHAIASADAVWTMDEYSYAAVGVLRKPIFGKKQATLIGQNIWMFDGLNRRSWISQKYISLIASTPDILTFHSKASLDLAREFLSDRNCKLIYFGISEDRFPIIEPRLRSEVRRIRVFACGHDKTRDWQTLMEALGNDDRFEVLLACSWAPDYENLYPNVTVRRRMTVSEQLEAYKCSDWVAVPTVENVYSGITVALEAAASGVPVVAARTGGIPTYFQEDEVLYYSPGNPADLRDVLLACSETRRLELASAAQHRFRDCDFTTLRMMQQYVRLSFI